MEPDVLPACPTEGVIDLLGKKWSLCAVATLAARPGLRFNALQDALPGISPRTLSDTLKALERHGIASRTAYAEVPPRVEYRLTAKGVRLARAMAPLMAWAREHEGPCCAMA